jgi:tape measure domain-containing protein
MADKELKTKFTADTKGAVSATNNYTDALRNVEKQAQKTSQALDLQSQASVNTAQKIENAKNSAEKFANNNLAYLQVQLKQATAELQRASYGSADFASKLANVKTYTDQISNIKGAIKTGLSDPVVYAKDSVMGLKERIAELQSQMMRMSPSSTRFAEMSNETGVLKNELDKAKASMNGLKGATNETANATGSMTSSFGTMASAVATGMVIFEALKTTITKVVDVIKSLVTDGFNMAMSIERATMGLSVFTGSAETAGQVIGYMRQEMGDAVALFGLDAMAKGTRQLMATGRSAKEATTLMYAMANAVSAVGGSPALLERLSLQMQDIGNKAKLTARDILQLQTAGIPITALLEETTGKSVEVLQQEGITYQMVSDAFIKAQEDGGLFQDALIKQADTLGGVLQVIKNDLQLMFSDLISETGVFDGVKESAKAFRDMLEQAKEPLMAIAKYLGSQLNQVVEETSLWFEWLNKKMADMGISGFDASKVLAGTLAVALRIVQFLIVGLTGIIAGLVVGINWWNDVTNTVAGAIADAFLWLSDVSVDVSNGIISAFESVGNGITRAIEGGINGAIDALNGLLQNDIFMKVMSFLPGGDKVAALASGGGIGHVSADAYMMNLQRAEKLSGEARQIARDVLAMGAKSLINPIGATMDAVGAIINAMGIDLGGGSGDVFNIEDLGGDNLPSDGSGGGGGGGGGGGSKSAKDTAKALADFRDKELKAIEKFNEEKASIEKKFEDTSADARQKALEQTLDLMEEFKTKSLDLKKTMDEGITKAVEKFKDKIVELKAEAVKASKEVTDKLAKDIESAYQKQTEKVLNVASLFKGEVTGQGLFQNILRGTERVLDFTNQIRQLQQSGLSDELVNYLKGQGVDAQRQVELLNQMTQDEIAQVNQAFAEQQQASRDLAVVQMEEEVDALNQTAQEELNKITLTFQEKGAEAKQAMMDEVRGLQTDYKKGMTDLRTETAKKMLDINDTMVKTIQDARTKMADEMQGLRVELLKTFKEIKRDMEKTFTGKSKIDVTAETQYLLAEQEKKAQDYVSQALAKATTEAEGKTYTEAVSSLESATGIKTGINSKPSVPFGLKGVGATLAGKTVNIANVNNYNNADFDKLVYKLNFI